VASQNSLVLGLVGASDVLIGIVLAVVGVAQDNVVLQVVGAALLVSGAGVVGWVTWVRNRPETL
jgi:hypothetical protein